MKIRKTPNPLGTSHWSKPFSLDILGQMVQIAVEGFSGPSTFSSTSSTAKLRYNRPPLARRHGPVLARNRISRDGRRRPRRVHQRWLPPPLHQVLRPPRDAAASYDRLEGTALMKRQEHVTELLEEHERFKDAVDSSASLKKKGGAPCPYRAGQERPVAAGPRRRHRGHAAKCRQGGACQQAAGARRGRPPHRAGHGEREDRRSVGRVAQSPRRLGFHPLLKACKTRTEVVVPSSPSSR